MNVKFKLVLLCLGMQVYRKTSSLTKLKVLILKNENFSIAYYSQLLVGRNQLKYIIFIMQSKLCIAIFIILSHIYTFNKDNTNTNPK